MGDRVCPACSRSLHPGQSYCVIDVIFMARRATNAYDTVKQREPAANSETLVGLALLWIDSGHVSHRSPHLGCPFCRVRV